jgi:hypothetical protein
VVDLLEKSGDIDKTRSYQRQNSEALQEIRDAVSLYNYIHWSIIDDAPRCN